MGSILYDPFFARLELCVNEQLLICGYALIILIERAQVTSHLRDKHYVDQRDRRGLTEHLNARCPLRTMLL
jgi:hypothetical protein